MLVLKIISISMISFLTGCFMLLVLCQAKVSLENTMLLIMCFYIIVFSKWLLFSCEIFLCIRVFLRKQSGNLTILWNLYKISL